MPLCRSLLAPFRIAAVGFVLLAVGVAAPLLVGLRAARRDAVLQTAARAMLRLLGVGLRVEGRPHPTLLVANHVSWIDALAVLAVAPVAFLAKREVASWPLIGALARVQGTVFVDRGRRRCIPAVNAEMADRLALGRGLLLFPEGTTSRLGARGRFHTSHLACLRSLLQTRRAPAAATVQPLAVTYSDEVAAWIGDDTLLAHIWRMLHAPPVTCTLVFGAPIAVQASDDRKRLGRHLATTVDALLSGVAEPPPCAPAGRASPIWRSVAFRPGRAASGTARDPARATTRSPAR